MDSGTIEEYVCWASGGLVRGSYSQGMDDLEMTRKSIQSSIDEYNDGERIDG